MPHNISVLTEEDPAFIVRVFATRIKRSLDNPVKLKILKSLKGKFALAFKDGQCLTVNVRNKEIYLARGVDKTAKIQIHLDADDPHAKPEVSGIYRHPFFALKLDKYLDDKDISWNRAALAFWEFAKTDKNIPNPIKVLASDINQQIYLSLNENEAPDTGKVQPELEIEGSAKNLASLFSGSSILIQDALKGRLKIIGSLEKQVEFTRVNLRYMLGA